LDAEVPVMPERYQGITIFDGILDGTRALIFCSEFGKQLFQQYGMNISMDGTFKVKIIYTIYNNNLIYY
jgi:hypothetical protein